MKPRISSVLPVLLVGLLVALLSGCAYISRATETATGVQADAGSGFASVSADGRWVAFRSLATNLVPGDTNGVYDVFVRDNLTKKVVRVSVADDGTQGNARSEFPSISDDGRRVAFASDATNLRPGDTNATPTMTASSTSPKLPIRSGSATPPLVKAGTEPTIDRRSTATATAWCSNLRPHWCRRTRTVSSTSIRCRSSVAFRRFRR